MLRTSKKWSRRQYDDRVIPGTRHEFCHDDLESQVLFGPHRHNECNLVAFVTPTGAYDACGAGPGFPHVPIVMSCPENHEIGERCIAEDWRDSTGGVQKLNGAHPGYG